MTISIRPRERDTIIQALSAGVVPRVGLQHIQVGRVSEVKAAIQDIDRIADKGGAFRVVIGPYGAGKTFYLNLVRSLALEKRLVTMQVDLAPDRRLHASGGQARNLYQEAVRTMATRAKPEGGALQNVVERLIGDANQASAQAGKSAEAIIQERLAPLRDYNGGFDFVTVVSAFCRGHAEGNEQLKSDAVRWLRGEFTTKTDAQRALGVRTIVGDDTVYDHLKLLSGFVQAAGYAGLFVILDEMVNLYKMQHSVSRQQNYEQILRILNDVLQGDVKGLGFYLGGTPEFLMDTRRGLYSYAALQSRLAENPFSSDGRVDFSGPVLRLANLTPEDLHVLLENVRRVFASGDDTKNLVPDEAIEAFMAHCNKHIGDAYFQTPRNSVRAFVQMLSTLEQNPSTAWSELIARTSLEKDMEPAGDGDDELTSFQL